MVSTAFGGGKFLTHFPTTPFGLTGATHAPTRSDDGVVGREFMPMNAMCFVALMVGAVFVLVQIVV
ncbi:hypothetical protein [Mycolicibacterium fortuitum]|uniref:hypothetical protein n=1 Tax=Mycolicibacterium fortuitum TaxID=1766 RepID=UPI002954D379|nr:hypothetical protein [Mycolicibacterium fortuitum]